jgi:hypothetical protein
MIGWYSRGIVGMLACAAAFLGVGAPAASAAAEAGPGWHYQSTFGSFNVVISEPERSPIVVDSSGNVLAVEQNYARVHIYSPAGDLLGYAAEGLTRNIAIDPSDDTLYADEVVAYGGSVIHRYASDGQPVPTYTVDPSFELPQGDALAVDPTTGDLLVADAAAEDVRRYDSSGTLLETINTPSINPAWIVTAPDGSFYVAPAEGPDVTHFSGSGTLLGTVAGIGSFTGLTYDSTTSVLVALVGGELKAYSPAGALLTESPAKDSNGIGIAYDAGSENIYEHNVAKINGYGPAVVPGIVEPDVSAVGPHTVHLSTEVDPGAGPPAGSEMHFELSADGGKTWFSTPSQDVNAAGTFEADPTDLLPNLEYLVRGVASNDLFSHTTDPVAFSTSEIAPEVVASNATDVTETSAVLNGTVNPAGLQTTFYFEYGTTTAYGSRVPVGSGAVAGAGRVGRIFSRTITDLQPATTYHFRIVAENSVGITQSADRSFTTTFAGETPLRGYEQVTPVDKEGNPLDVTLGFQVSEEGSAIAYNNRGGDQSSPTHAFAMSRRGAEDWESGIDLTTPLNSTSKLVGQIINTTTLAISPDLTRSFVATNAKLTPEASEDGTNLYRMDNDTDAYDFVGTFSLEFGLPGFIAVEREDKYVAGAKDFSWIVFTSEVPLLPGAPGDALYRWSEDGGLEVVSVLPDGEEAGIVRNNPASPPIHQVSDDGSRIYFAVPFGYSEGGVFLHEEGKPTKAVSVSRVPGDSEVPQQARIMGTSADGRYLFFYSNLARLTSDAPNEFEKADMYRYDAADDSLEYLGAGAQVDAFEGLANPENSSISTMGVSEDGSTIYFRPVGEAIRVWRNGTISEVYNHQLGSSFGAPSMSPNGRYFLYETGSDPEQPIYLYDADRGSTDCLTCLANGDPGGGDLPQREHFVSNYVPRAITNAGQAFFTSADRLVAADVNGNKDVYMYQDGKHTLISPGDGNYQAIFSDVSKDAHDVYFTTNQKLVGRDNDETPDIYDARIGGGLPSQSPPPPQECLRDDCKATPGAGPELPFGGTEALSGPENVKPAKHRKKCGKGKHAKKVKGKVRCVKNHGAHKQRANKAGKGGNR